MNLFFKNMKTALVSLSTAAMLTVSVSSQAALLNVQQIEIRNALGEYLQVNQIAMSIIGDARTSDPNTLKFPASIIHEVGVETTDLLNWNHHHGKTMSDKDTTFIGGSGKKTVLTVRARAKAMDLSSFSLRSRYNSKYNYRDVYNVVFKDKDGNVLHELKNWDGRIANNDLLRQNEGLLTTNFHEVPIPAAALLFAPALVGFMGLRRKAKAKI